MHVKIKRDVDIFVETREMLILLVKRTNIKELEKMLKGLGLKEETFLPVLQVREHILKTAAKKFEKKMDLLQEYYTPMRLGDDSVHVLADFVFGVAKGEAEVSLKKRREELEHVTEEWRVWEILKMLDEEETEQYSYAKMVSVLAESELTEEKKWKVVQVATNPKEHLEKIYPLLEEAAQIFLSYQQEWQPFLERMIENWSNYLEEEKIETIMQEYFNVDVLDNPQGVMLVPEIMECNTIAYHFGKVDITGVKERDVFRLGYFFSTMENVEILTNPRGREPDEKEYLIQALKCLADKSKLEILLALRKKRMYGSELAEMLHLTTATVSHHMNTLIVLKLVFVEKEENKSYYRVNQRELEKVLELMKELLL